MAMYSPSPLVYIAIKKNYSKHSQRLKGTSFSLSPPLPSIPHPPPPVALLLYDQTNGFLI